MIFASKAFFVFLVVVLTTYHLLPRRGQKYTFLLAASWALYAWVSARWGSPWYFGVIFFLTVVDYFVGLRIERATTDRARKAWLAASVVSNLALLVGFKYTPFAYDNYVFFTGFLGTPVPDRAWTILLPLGISFHTFQGISYTVDVYRRQIRAVPNFVDYALFVAFFPQLAAGPIVRAIEFLPQMVAPPRVTAAQVSDGIALFAFGLFKKLVIADNLDALFVNPVFADPAAFDAATHRWAVVAWAVQIYCDFSGYTDMAIGTAKWFGFELPSNFRCPYLATSITDFWRRWHLTLSTWLRDYFYFPMGGSRGSAPRTYFNLMFLFVLCGLWHGAAWNWLAYGAFNGVLMCLHRAYDRAVTGIVWVDALRANWGWKVFAWACTTYQFLVMLILVRMTSWANGWLMTRSLTGADWEPLTAAAHPPPFVPWVAGAPLLVPVLIALGLAGHVVGLMKEAGVPLPERLPDPIRMAAVAATICAILAFAPGVSKTFIYIQF
ncbi:MBOAT family O-acyltransferase [Fimbriiglobus ruber]|uniref:Putative poly(Beta-D-mannuronate) O-acetylase n=1 Tax=Fimbriiglobus ruber TaxID=1908690 RepID=A0A225D449_9BACT|nr:MBOAT family O-acyltransferase [Fimbriiglobus ruber]OWK36360.1 putative poly(beta-D-mannuronate) O-acetylase [Fimbriiglobus ruber]